MPMESAKDSWLNPIEALLVLSPSPRRFSVDFSSICQISRKWYFYFYAYICRLHICIVLILFLIREANPWLTEFLTITPKFSARIYRLIYEFSHRHCINHSHLDSSLA